MTESMDVEQMRKHLEVFVRPRTATLEISLSRAARKLLEDNTEERQGENDE